ncbi:MAG: hypothetical protein ABI675_10950 [Chitinophagaceae bacterium]
MKTISILVLAMSWQTLLLQGQTGKSILVKAGEDIAKTYSPNGFYRLPQFSKAELFRRTVKTTSNLLFNYNIYFAKIQFINERGDTLDLINPSLFDSIIIGKNVFYYDDGFLELAASSDPLRLVKKTRIRMWPESTGAYGISNPTGSTDKVSNYTIGNNVYSFSTSENMIVKESIDWFWMNEEDKIVKASKSNMLLLLPSDKQEKARAYLKANKISFEKEQDLKKLMENL